MLNLSASRASFSNVPPNVTPGIVVLISPVALRISRAASIFGSKVSNCDGPPCMKRKITDLSFKTGLPFLIAA